MTSEPKKPEEITLGDILRETAAPTSPGMRHALERSEIKQFANVSSKALASSGVAELARQVSGSNSFLAVTKRNRAALASIARAQAITREADEPIITRGPSAGLAARVEREQKQLDLQREIVEQNKLIVTNLQALNDRMEAEAHSGARDQRFSRRMQIAVLVVTCVGILTGALFAILS